MPGSSWFNCHLKFELCWSIYINTHLITFVYSLLLNLMLIYLIYLEKLNITLLHSSSFFLDLLEQFTEVIFP